MEQLRELFSRRQLPKLLLIGAVYLVGRMDGEGRFTWSDILGSAYQKITALTLAATESARGVVGM